MTTHAPIRTTVTATTAALVHCTTLVNLGRTAPTAATGLSRPHRPHHRHLAHHRILHHHLECAQTHVTTPTMSTATTAAVPRGPADCCRRLASGVPSGGLWPLPLVTGLDSVRVGSDRGAPDGRFPIDPPARSARAAFAGDIRNARVCSDSTLQSRTRVCGAHGKNR